MGLDSDTEGAFNLDENNPDENLVNRLRSETLPSNCVKNVDDDTESPRPEFDYLSSNSETKRMSKILWKNMDTTSDFELPLFNNMKGSTFTINDANKEVQNCFLSSRRLRSYSLFSQNSIWNNSSCSQYSHLQHSNMYKDKCLDFDLNSKINDNNIKNGSENFNFLNTKTNSRFGNWNGQNKIDNCFGCYQSFKNCYVNKNLSCGLNDNRVQEMELPYQPLLIDDYNFSHLILSTSFDYPSMSPTKFLLIDNLPKYINSMKLWTILSYSMNNLRFIGYINEIRIMLVTNFNLALIECSNIELATMLKNNFNYYELLPYNIIHVAFTNIVNNKSPTHSVEKKNFSKVLKNDYYLNNGSLNIQSSYDDVSKYNFPSKEDQSSEIVNDEQMKAGLMETIKEIITNYHSFEMKKINKIINKSSKYLNFKYKTNFGIYFDPMSSFQFDSPKLRELRKILENTETAYNSTNDLSEFDQNFNNTFTSPKVNSNDLFSNDENLKNPSSYDSNSSNSSSCYLDFSNYNSVLTQLELEEICLIMLEKLPELCYDYLGNMIVQKIFVLLKSPVIRLMMVKTIAPYLTQLSVHKSGTWAIQKIINTRGDDYHQKIIIGKSLKPFSIKLFNDQFGNYVIQGCIKFNQPYNNFIFESILDNFLEISYGRFGARCIRTILETANENKHITDYQIVLVSALIVEFSNKLVVNNNGVLLITWFLDTFIVSSSASDNRYLLLTKKLLPNLSYLCTHKLANLTVLKILNNRTDSKLKEMILDEIFGKFDYSKITNDNIDKFVLETKTTDTLKNIFLDDPKNILGPLFIFKILSNPLILSSNEILLLNTDDYSNKTFLYKQFIVLKVKKALLEMKITNVQNYKKILDEVGLSNSFLNRTCSLSERNKKHSNKNEVNFYGAYPSMKKLYMNSMFYSSPANSNSSQDETYSQSYLQMKQNENNFFYRGHLKSHINQNSSSNFYQNSIPEHNDCFANSLYLSNHLADFEKFSRGPQKNEKCYGLNKNSILDLKNLTLDSSSMKL